jgi:hypothetical protein
MAKVKDEVRIFTLVQDYLDGKLTLFDLQDWISSREEYWGALPRESPGRQLAGSVMLSYYEYGAGDRDEESVREVTREELREIARQPA